jgi:hypothetical protein
MQTATQMGEHYFSTFTDVYSHHVSVYLQKTKDETLSKLQIHIPRVETVTGQHINYFRSDGGGEYDSDVFRTYLRERGIHHEITNAYTPQENGVSEQMNRTIMEMARCLLHDSGLPRTFWGYTVLHSAHILNILPSCALNTQTTPEEILIGNKPSIAHLRIFGCTAYVHIPKEKRQKLDIKTMECIYIGHAENRKAYQLYHTPSRRIFQSRDVTFNEGIGIVLSRITIEMGSPSTPEEKIMPDEEDAPRQVTSIDDNPNDVLPNAIPQLAPEPRRSMRIRRTPVADDDERYTVTSYGNTTPKTNTQVGNTTLAPSQANKRRTHQRTGLPCLALMTFNGKLPVPKSWISSST